jgi:hypothetical protein
MLMAEQAWCKHVKEDGTSCAAKAMPSGYCWFHDPAIKEKRDDARQRGAKQTKRRRSKIVLPPATADLPLSNVDEVVAALGVAFNQVRKGELDVRVGNCLGLLAGTLLRAFRGEKDEITLNVKPALPGKPLIGPEVLEGLLANVRREKAATIDHPPQIGLRELPPVQTNGESIDHAV